MKWWAPGSLRDSLSNITVEWGWWDGSVSKGSWCRAKWSEFKLLDTHVIKNCSSELSSDLHMHAYPSHTHQENILKLNHVKSNRQIQYSPLASTYAHRGTCSLHICTHTKHMYTIIRKNKTKQWGLKRWLLLQKDPGLLSSIHIAANNCPCPQFQRIRYLLLASVSALTYI